MCKRILKHQTNTEKGVPFYKIGTFGKKADAFISEELYKKYKNKYNYPEKGDILISAAGTLGETVVYDGNPAYFQDSNIVWLKHDNTKAINKFLLYVYAMKPWKVPESSTIPRLYNDNILNTYILLPPLAEQEKIAEILGTWDSAIEKLTALIAAKRLQKKGLMQKLLTAQIRLPGFTGEWEKVKLGDFLKFQTGFPFDSQFFNQASDGIRLVKNRDLKSDDQVYFYSGKYANTDIVENGDILVGMDGDFLPCLWKKGIALLNQRVGKIVCKKTLNHTFAYYILFSPLEKIQNETASTTVKHLSHSGVEKTSVTIPTDISEQKAIADILSKADEEIDLLTRKLDLLQSQKKGLMQQLLTGKIRVKVA